MKLTKLQREVLELIGGFKEPFWYWSGADFFEPANYEEEQEKYGSTLYDMAIDVLYGEELITTVRVKDAANAEYYRITNRGKKKLKELGIEGNRSKGLAKRIDDADKRAEAILANLSKKAEKLGAEVRIVKG